MVREHSANSRCSDGRCFVPQWHSDEAKSGVQLQEDCFTRGLMLEKGSRSRTARRGSDMAAMSPDEVFRRHGQW